MFTIQPNFPMMKPNQMGLSIADAMKAYQDVTNAAYAPQMRQAELFNQEMGPFSAMAANPNFEAFNPQIAEMIRQRAAQHFKKTGNPQHEGILSSILNRGKQMLGAASQNANETDNPPQSGRIPGFPSPQEIYNQIEIASKKIGGPGTHHKVFRAEIAGNIGGAFNSPKLRKAFGGTQAVDDYNALLHAQSNAADYFKRIGKNPEIAKQGDNESNEAYKKRIGRELLGSQQPTRAYKPAASGDVADNSPQIMELNEAAKDFGFSADDIVEAANAFGTNPEYIISGLRAGITNNEEMKKYINAIKNEK